MMINAARALRRTAARSAAARPRLVADAAGSSSGGGSRRRLCHLSGGISQAPATGVRAFASSSSSSEVAVDGGRVTDDGWRKHKKATKRAKHLLVELEREHVSQLQAHPERKKWPAFSPGDAIEVQYKTALSKTRYQKMRGIVLGRKNRGIGSSFVLHNIIAGEAFEIKFPLYSPLIENITMVKPAFIHKGKKRVRRAKLNYLRGEIASRITVKDTH
jgi:large subunit ribosomal protein L19